MPRDLPQESPLDDAPTTTEPASQPQEAPSRPSRRAFLGGLGVAGLTAGAVACRPPSDTPTDLDDIAAAERLAGLQFDADDRALMLDDVVELRAGFERLRTVSLDNSVPPALGFEPGRLSPDTASDAVSAPTRDDRALSAADEPSIDGDDDLAFASLRHLGSLLRSGDITSRRLTELYLDRLDRFDPQLECVITRTAERALAAADAADRELEAGQARGPLHGIPWGAKDLLAVRGYPTTWGATPFRDQVIDQDAAVVEQLDRAGAVLIAKLTLGALAWGDVWFDGTTRNPWNLEQGSSGSSAGSASATAAGLAGFTIGSETLGSIVSPCTRCGATGLRPTFGRVSRHGAMALSWTMDKLGPITRSADDCGLVFEPLAGQDPRDPYSAGGPYLDDADLDPTSLRVGVVRSAFDAEREDDAWRQHDLAVIETLEGLGLDLVDFELPIDDLPINDMLLPLSVEAAAAFDELTRSGRDDELVRQVADAWPNVFRQARLIPAVEYVQANRLRTLLIQRFCAAMTDIDVYVCPSYGGGSLRATNLTGHPAVVLPNGFRDDGTPTSITFTGRLFGEGPLLAVARAYQQATDFHRRRPELKTPAGG